MDPGKKVDPLRCPNLRIPKKVESRTTPSGKHFLPESARSEILNEIGRYIVLQSKIELPKSPLNKAYSYCLKRWDNLIVYINYGALEIDNNHIENTILFLALGEKILLCFIPFLLPAKK